MLLCAVTVASAAAWVVAPDASAQPQDRVVIALADDETPCAPAALEAVTAALQDVEDVDRAKQTVVIAVAWPAAEGRQSAADEFTLAQYRTLAGVPANDAWLVQRGAYDCPETPRVRVGRDSLQPAGSAGRLAEGERHEPGSTPVPCLGPLRQAADRWGWERADPVRAGAGRLAAVAVVIALVLRARGRRDQVAVAPPPPPPPPPPPKPPKPLQPPAPLGITREEAASQPEQVVPKGAQPFVLRPMTTLDGLVASKLRTDLASVAPERHGSAAVWASRARASSAPPSIRRNGQSSVRTPSPASSSPRPRAVLLGVYDGLGGAGSTVVETAGGLTFNEAFVASRVVREEAEAWFMHGATLRVARRTRSYTPGSRSGSPRSPPLICRSEPPV